MATASHTMNKATEAKRVARAHQHVNKEIIGFWDCIHFTDEAHFNEGMSNTPYIAREQGTHYDKENLAQKRQFLSSRIDIAGSVNCYSRIKNLIFYNDENDKIVVPKPPPRPRKRMYEPESEYF